MSDSNIDRVRFSSLIWFTNPAGIMVAAFHGIDDARGWACTHLDDFVHFGSGAQLGARFAMEEDRTWWEQRRVDGGSKPRPVE